MLSVLPKQTRTDLNCDTQKPDDESQPSSGADSVSQPSEDTVAPHANDDLDSNADICSEFSSDARRDANNLLKVKPNARSDRNPSATSKDSGVGDEAKTTDSADTTGSSVPVEAIICSANKFSPAGLQLQDDNPTDSTDSGFHHEPEIINTCNMADPCETDIYCTCEGSEVSDNFSISKLDADQTSISQGRLGFFRNKEQEIAERMPDSHLFFAVLMSVFTPMFGIPALIMAIKCKDRIKARKVEEAWKYSVRALILSLIGVWWIGLMIMVCYIMIVLGYESFSEISPTAPTIVETGGLGTSAEVTHSRLFKLPYLRRHGTYGVTAWFPGQM